MKTLDDLPAVWRVRHRISRLWPRRSKKFDGFERVSLHSYTPEYGDLAEIRYALLDPAGAHCLRRSHFETPGSLPTWNNLRIRKLYNRLPFDVRWGRGVKIVKLWVGETPSGIQPFEY